MILRRVQDLNLRAGISRFDGFRVRCITTLPTLRESYCLIFFAKMQVLFVIFLMNPFFISLIHCPMRYKNTAQSLFVIISNNATLIPLFIFYGYYFPISIAFYLFFGY